jgi:phage-related minor tail protein
MTAKEALASFFQSVGDMFIKMAAEIIAKQTVMITLQLILKALGAITSAAGPATGAAASKGYTLPKGGGYAGGFSMAPILGRASGGPVDKSTPYVVGERGPELFVPGTGGTVVNNRDLRNAMGTAPGASNGPVLNMSFQTTNIGGVEYVSRDQLEAAMVATRKAAANDGAKRGTAATLSRLQNSPSTRAKLGLR